ncbi:MAG: hypothetical protein E3J72_01190 [Planctomycetota bacterium]|nr:MAG: hypothetical protein E3J72_01190 [Planctomycetota bacterium]
MHTRRIALIVIAAVLALAVGPGFSGDDPDKPEKKLTYAKAKSQFNKAFKSKKPDERAEAVKKFAKQNDPRAVKLILKRALFEDSRLVADAAFEGLTGLTEPRAWKIIFDRLKKEKSADKRLILARLLGFYKDATNEIILGLEKALDDDSRDVRIAVLRSLGQIKAKRSTKVLEKLLDDKDLRIVFETAKALEAITGIKRETYADPKHKGTYPEKVFTRYMCILIDASGDMDYDMPVPAADHDLIRDKLGIPPEKEKDKAEEKDKKEKKKKRPKKSTRDKKKKEKEEEPPAPEDEYPKDVLTRFQYAAKKLAQFLGRLDKRVEVKIAFFSSVVSPYVSSYVPAGELNLKKLEERAAKLRPRGNRDLYKVLRSAFSEENLDTILLVSSGLPTVGLRDADSILDNVQHLNRYRTVEIITSALHSLQTTSPLTEEVRVGLNEEFDKSADLLQKLAKATGGTFTKLQNLREPDTKTKKPTAEKPEKPVKPEEKPGEKPAKPLTLKEAKKLLDEGIKENDIEKIRRAAGDIAKLKNAKAVETLAKEFWELDNPEFVQIGVEAMSSMTDVVAIIKITHMLGDEKNETKRLLFLRVLRSIKHLTAERTIIERFKKDKSWRVKSQIARILGELKLEKGRGVLKAALKDKNPRIAYDAAVALSNYKGETLGNEFKAEAPLVFPSKVFSQRLAVVVCAARSMGAEVVDPDADWKPKTEKEKKKGPPKVSRLEVVRRRLDKFIDGLPASTELMILTFGDGVGQWKSEFAAMTRSNREAAKKYVKKLRPVGRNRALDTALLRAMDLTDVDMICIVTDGVPEGRDVLSPDELAGTVGDINYFRMAYIHATAVLDDATYKEMSAVDKVTFNREKDNTIKMLREITNFEGGTCFEVTPEE